MARWRLVASVRGCRCGGSSPVSAGRSSGPLRPSEGLDLSTGTLSVNRPGLVIHVRLGRLSRGSNRLTPFQCALLARALLYKKKRQADLLATAARDLTQPEYARRVSLEWEVPESWLAPVVISRFLEALRREGILIETEGIASLDELRAYEVLR